MPQPTPDGHMIRAGAADAAGIAALIAEAFSALDVAAWLVPDLAERTRVLADDLRILVDHALDHGIVWRTSAGTGAAVWLPRERGDLPAIDDYDRRLSQACGPHLPRFQILDEQFEAHHPKGPAHHHLALLAVAPDARGKGVGSFLLDRHHRQLDAAGLGAYLEASSPRSRALYLRRGYADFGPPFDLPDGPRIWPMWRTPARTPAPFAAAA